MPKVVAKAVRKRAAPLRRLLMTSVPDGFRITTEATDRVIVAGDFQCHHPDVLARMVRIYNNWIDRQLAKQDEGS